MTKSEDLFERYCAESKIEFRRIEEGTQKNPDYELTLGEVKVIAEVKQFDRNEEEKASDELLKSRGYGEVQSVTPGDRVRKKIKDALPQIRRKTKGKHPGVLVLFDRGLVAGHIDPYNIRVAMYGLENVNFAIPCDPRQGPRFTGTSYGPKRKMTETDNTSISAIASLYAVDSHDLRLDIYHNIYAVVPLDMKNVAEYGMAQYTLEREVEGRTAGWEKIEL